VVKLMERLPTQSFPRTRKKGPVIDKRTSGNHIRGAMEGGPELYSRETIEIKPRGEGEDRSRCKPR